MNLPDTVNDSRIRALMEPFGPLSKIVLRPDHQGAIVEFMDTSSSGKAALEIEGYELLPNTRLHVGTVKELLSSKPEKKSSRLIIGKQVNGLLPQATVPIRRPQSLRKGGLGNRRGGIGLGHDAGLEKAESKSVDSKDDFPADESLRETQKMKPKSNADFRALISRNPATGSSH